MNTALSKNQKRYLASRDGFRARVREKNEALPRTFAASQITEFPKMEPIRPGANDHLKVERKGVNC